jgi:hypothetical protein
MIHRNKPTSILVILLTEDFPFCSNSTFCLGNVDVASTGLLQQIHCHTDPASFDKLRMTVEITVTLEPCGRQPHVLALHLALWY